MTDYFAFDSEYYHKSTTLKSCAYIQRQVNIRTYKGTAAEHITSLLHFRTVYKLRHTLPDSEDISTLDIGMIKFRWKDSMTRVSRTMKTMYAAFSKSVN